MSQTNEEKLYAKIVLKICKNGNDNFEMVATEFEYVGLHYRPKRWKLLLSSAFADSPTFVKGHVNYDLSAAKTIIAVERLPHATFLHDGS